MNYALNFVLPRGDIGPTGPQGIAGTIGATGPTGPIGPGTGLSAYGGRYNNTASTINLSILSQTQVPLEVTMPNLAVNYSPNSLVITQSGNYEINFYLNLTATVATTITTAVRINGTNIPATVISRALSVATSSIYNGSVIVALTAGNTIDMAISALLAVGVTLGTGTNAVLTVKRLS